MRQPTILIVGAGITGCTLARILAEKDFQVKIIESRNHIGGNVYDLKNDLGLRYHAYGPHLFHTNNAEVVHFLSRFTQWDTYFHQVRALDHQGDIVVFPVQKSQIHKYRDQDEIRRIFFEPYSRKMWGCSLSELDHTVIQRVGRRENDSSHYFQKDKYQMLPKNGYTAMIENMIDHKNISVDLNTFFHPSFENGFDHVFYSGPIDAYFNYEFGYLPYRSIKFTHTQYPIPQLLPSMQMNFTLQSEYTRITDWSHLPENHRQSSPSTMLTFELPCDSRENHDERYYPIKDKDGQNRRLYNQYATLAKPHITFLGRLGKYAYLDMDQAVASAMNAGLLFAKKN